MQSWQAAHLGLGSGSLDYSEAPCIRLWAPLSLGSSMSALRRSRSGAGSNISLLKAWGSSNSPT